MTTQTKNRQQMPHKKDRPIDLHVHSTYSDGSLSPQELVTLAKEKNLAAFALTDHDTTEGIDSALSSAQNSALEIIPGIELSTKYGESEIHILGLYIDHHNESFQTFLTQFQESRIQRNQSMCKKLNAYGVMIDYDELANEYADSVITRAHFARYLLKKGYVKSHAEAFDRYVGDHAPCYIPRSKIAPEEGISLIQKCGGFAVLAHPILYHMSDERLDALVARLKDAGIGGIEAVYSTYHEREERKIRALAQKYDLLLSGGSDFHGKAKPGLELGNGYGKLFVPYAFLEKIKEHMHLT